MALICRKYNLLFISMPATGCSSIGDVLIDSFGGEHLPGKSVYQSGQLALCHKHNRVGDLVKHDLISKNQVKSLRKFSTVRNPFDYYATQYERFSGEWIERAINRERKTLDEDIGSDQREWATRWISDMETQRLHLKEIGFSG
ncbi:sulfotransferase family 2 domain-containing protein [bacterium]|nr:sulfotransferase family 2 domain-containing protein [bacterium]